MPQSLVPGSDSHLLEVSDVIEETSDAHSLIFAIPEESAAAFSYRPGQFLTVRVPCSYASLARCYSLSSSPYTDTTLKVTVKRVANGRGSNWLCDNIVSGSTVEVLPPSGSFSPKTLSADFLLFAGGSGITPVMSIAKSALAEGTGRVVLIYANRDEKSVIFADELRALGQRYPDRLTVIHWLETVQGLPDMTTLRTLAEPFAGFDAFVCGPGVFMDAAVDALKSLGMPKTRIQVERFLSLERSPFDSEVEPPAPETSTTEQEATVDVELDGQRHQLEWPRRTRLLDLLLEKGISAPYSCREGSCSACACRIEGGEVTMLRNNILDQADLDEGIVLACQSLPVTDEVRVSYE